MKDLIYKKRDVLGLDIGTSNVKFVQLKEKGTLTKLIGYGHFKVPENIIIEGIVSEPEKLAEIIKKELSDPPWGKITAERVVVALPDSKLFTRTLELPIISEKDIHGAVALEIEQSIPMASTDLYTDWQIVRETKDKIYIFMAAAPRSIVDSYVQLMNLISMEPIAFDISLSAVSRSVIPKNLANRPHLILDIGGQTTNMAIYDNGIQITGSHPIGAELIKDTLKSALMVNDKEAENILGIGIKEGEKSTEIIKKELSVLVTEIERLFKYFKDQREDAEIAGIILCGGLGAMEGLGDFLSEELKIKVELGNSWSNISIYPLKPVPKKEAAMYAAAIGLALRGLKDE
ncbi:MAG: type IV pilus assembly protein PilM [Patescibacteria group bacterium]|nr:type IV pilus assembly protein PilM [Patescibacteria group bacterium]